MAKNKQVSFEEDMAQFASFLFEHPYLLIVMFICALQLGSGGNLLSYPFLLFIVCGSLVYFLLIKWVQQSGDGK